MLDDQQWVDEFSTEQKENGDIRDSANQLLGMVDDPKFANSEVVRFTCMICQSEVFLHFKTLVAIFHLVN